MSPPCSSQKKTDVWAIKLEVCSLSTLIWSKSLFITASLMLNYLFIHRVHQMTCPWLRSYFHFFFHLWPIPSGLFLMVPFFFSSYMLFYNIFFKFCLTLHFAKSLDILCQRLVFLVKEIWNMVTEAGALG